MRMKVQNLFTVAVILACLSPRLVSGQGEENTGPVRFSIGVMLESTDNRDSAPDGFEESNVDFFLRPQVDLVARGDITDFVFSYAPTYRYRTDPSAFQNDTELYHDLGVTLEHKMAPNFTVRLADQFNYTDDPAVQEGGTTLRRDSSFTLNRVSAGANYSFTPRANIDLSARALVKKYKETAQQIESGEKNSGVALTLWRQMTANAGMLLAGDLSSHEYESVEGIERGFTKMQGAVGLERIVSTQMRGSVRVGMEKVDYDDDTLDAETSPYVSLGMDLSTVPTMRINASLTHTRRNADEYPWVSQQYTDVYGRLAWDVSRFTWTVAGTYRLGQYDGGNIPAGASSSVTGQRDGDEVTLIGSLGVAYHFDNYTSLQLLHSYETVDSDVGFDFDRNATRVLLSKRL